MRRAAKVDSNQQAVTNALRQIGCSVVSTASLGRGMGDILVGFRGRTLWYELKDGDKPPSATVLTPDEAAFHSSWRGHIQVVDSIPAALEAVQSDASKYRLQRAQMMFRETGRGACVGDSTPDGYVVTYVDKSRVLEARLPASEDPFEVLQRVFQWVDTL